ncbi:M20 metallopeptidase family protein [Sporanaerobacter sp. PP17-6a]|jgi:amidohydrolase|uniref:M20 metallopeptidase family protein n=1 Tax=Sporanaerobacter sp. PP17-6a TaxID=1891289 RepID=UPI00089FD02E|nr:M20 family metallopeptidase [Sporanaerobacter sp. PP17-6a]SCL91749.1 putative hydrolase YxeP [Sporanaerobacter sp. PP17-6a]
MDIKSRAMDIKDWVIGIRRDFHMHPELGFEEYRTRDKIIENLKEIGIEYRIVANTGVVGIIRGKEGGKTVALRADMDALPIKEKNDVLYKSKVEGKMHACGHDAHSAILLGVSRILNDIKDELKGNVKLFFQPAEETTGGAKPMIEQGVLENPKVDGIFGLHVDNGLDAGQIGIRYGQMNAASDMIKIIIEGKNSHGAYPDLGVDAIAIAAYVITAIQTIISRNTDPRNSGVISLGVINGGYAGNIIADRVEIEGIVRTLDEETRERTIERIKNIVEKVAESMGGKGEIKRRKSYNALINDDKMVDIIKQSGEGFLEKKNVIKIKYPSFGVEDFSFFSEKCSGGFFLLGSKNEEKNIVYRNHTPKFDIDEDCLVYGVMVQVQNVLNFLNGN